MLVLFQKSLCFNTANNFYTVAANYQRKTNEAAHDIVQEVFLLRIILFFCWNAHKFFRFFFRTVGMPGTNYALSATPECHWTEFHSPLKKASEYPNASQKMSHILPSPVHQLSAQRLDLSEKMLCNPDYSTRNISRKGIRPREVRPREAWAGGQWTLRPRLALTKLKFAVCKV